VKLGLDDTGDAVDRQGIAATGSGTTGRARVLLAVVGAGGASIADERPAAAVEPVGQGGDRGGKQKQVSEKDSFPFPLLSGGDGTVAEAFGTKRRAKIGNFGTLTVEQARREAKVLLGKVASGEDP
jgi:hypothetical protein